MKKKTVLILLSTLGIILLFSGLTLLFKEKLQNQFLNSNLESNYAYIYKYEKEGSNTKLYVNNYDSGEVVYEVLTYPTYLLNSNIVLDSDLPAEVSIEIKNFRYHISLIEKDEDFTRNMLNEIEDLYTEVDTIYSNDIMYFKFALAEIYSKSNDQETKDRAKEVFDFYSLPALENSELDAFGYSINRPYACLIQEEILNSGITELETYSELCDLPDFETDISDIPVNVSETEFTIPEEATVEEFYSTYGITELEEKDLITLSSTVLLDSTYDDSKNLDDIYKYEFVNTRTHGLTADNACYWMQVNSQTEYSNNLKENISEDMRVMNTIYCTEIHGFNHAKYLTDLRFKDIAFALYEYEN